MEYVLQGAGWRGLTYLGVEYRLKDEDELHLSQRCNTVLVEVEDEWGSAMDVRMYCGGPGILETLDSNGPDDGGARGALNQIGTPKIYK